MKTPLKLFLPLAAVVAIFASNAQAVVYVDEFPSADSTVVGSVGVIAPGEFGFFWSVARGDSIEETFTGTGLNTVFQLDLEFAILDNVLNRGASVFWDVLVNGIVVGNWSWSDTDGLGTVSESYSFAPIFGGGDYTIRMEVTNEVADGFGSISIGYPGDMKLHGTVPDTGSTLALLGLGLAGLIGIRRRFAK